MSLEGKFCVNIECPVSKTGACYEGHNPCESCPNFRTEQPNDPIEENDDVSDEVTDVSALDSDLLELSIGDALNVEELDELMRAVPVNIIAIIGDREAGKTTLISALYQSFLKGPFQNKNFAGSRTLVGFEKITHLSRAVSGLDDSDTDRTSRASGLRFYHLAVVSKEHKKYQHIIADRAGEFYKEARGNSVLIDQLTELSKCKFALILLDGSKMLNTDCYEAVYSAKQTLRAFLDSGKLPAGIKFQFVMTKADLFVNDAASDKAYALWKQFQTEIKKEFSHVEVDFFHISSRDPVTGMPSAEFADLFESWHKNPSVKDITTPQLSASASERDRLLERLAWSKQQ